MKINTLTVISAAAFLTLTPRIQATLTDLPPVDIQITENSSTSLAVTSNGFAQQVSLDSSDHWSTTWLPSQVLAFDDPVVISFREPNSADGYNNVTISLGPVGPIGPESAVPIGGSGLMTVASDQPNPIQGAPIVDNGGTFSGRLLLGISFDSVLQPNVPALPGIDLTVTFNDNGDEASQVPDSGSTAALLFASVFGAFALAKSRTDKFALLAASPR